MKSLPPLGLRRPPPNSQDWNRPAHLPPDIGGGEAQPALRHKQHQAMVTGNVSGAHRETGVSKSTAPRDWSKSSARPLFENAGTASYPDRSLAGGRELGHNHLHDVTDREAAQMREDYLDNAAAGQGNSFAETQRFNTASNGIQRLGTGRAGQSILSATRSNNRGRIFGACESSIRQLTRGSTTNEGSTNHRPNNGYAIRQVDPNIQVRVNEKVSNTLAGIVVDDEDGYEWWRGHD
jgi:hypothetical protein